MEHKRRRRDVLVDDEKIYQFYDSQIPGAFTSPAVSNAGSRMSKRVIRMFYVCRKGICCSGIPPLPPCFFPDHLDIGTTAFKLTYRFEPGHALDGVTAHIPIHQLNNLQQADFDWLVPGLIREKLTNLFKTLPKALRRHLVPMPGHGKPVPGMGKTGDDVAHTSDRILSRACSELKGLKIRQTDWQLTLFTRSSENGFSPAGSLMVKASQSVVTLIALNRSSEELPTKSSMRHQAGKYSGRISTAGILADLPLQDKTALGNMEITGYPALCVDEQDMLSIDVFDDAATAEQFHHAGLQALILKSLPEQVTLFTQTVARPAAAMPVLFKDRELPGTA